MLDGPRLVIELGIALLLKEDVINDVIPPLKAGLLPLFGNRFVLLGVDALMELEMKLARPVLP